jgi:hypothetical protein
MRKRRYRPVTRFGMYGAFLGGVFGTLLLAGCAVGVVRACTP